MLKASNSFAHWKTRRWIKENRHYTAYLQQDLFGDWCVIKAWGSTLSHHGRRQIVSVASYEQGLQLLDVIADRRRKHLYREIAL